MESAIGEVHIQAAPIPVGPTVAERAALRVLQLGAVAVVLVVVTNREFELDRFFVPKELALHVTALAAGLLAVGAFRRIALTRIDLLLVAYLLLGLVSTMLAENRELAVRALMISVSGVAVFWAARAVREAGLARPLLRVLAFAAVLGTVTSLVQAYGVELELFSINRAPGGTLGNRNFIAHMAAFGLPVVLLVALRAWRPAGYAIGAVGVAIVIATLILTRSRAGWLAFAGVIVVFAAAMLLSRPLRSHGRSWRRLLGILLLMGAAVLAAVTIPNSLRWRSENPYLETMAGIANYQEGSGAGRLVQYGRSLMMALDRPLFGVGPGNWSEVYPEYAAPDDPSMARSDPGSTANPWPSSDWVAFAAERGFAAAALLGLVFIGIVLSAARRLLRARDEEEALLAAGLLGILIATLLSGLFDAVLLLAAPTLLVWTGIGALWPPADASRPPPGTRESIQAVLLFIVAVAAGFGAFRSAVLLAGM